MYFTFFSFLPYREKENENENEKEKEKEKEEIEIKGEGGKGKRRKKKAKYNMHRWISYSTYLFFRHFHSISGTGKRNGKNVTKGI